MRILMVSEDLPGAQVGGLGKHVVTLANRLLADGHQVEILGRNDRGLDGCAGQIGFHGRFVPGFDLARPGWKEAQLGVFNPLKRPYFARRIGRAIARHASGHDVVHYHGHLPMVGLYLPDGVNYVQTRHDQGSECLIHLRFRDGAVCDALAPAACAGCIRRADGSVPGPRSGSGSSTGSPTRPSTGSSIRSSTGSSTGSSAGTDSTTGSGAGDNSGPGSSADPNPGALRTLVSALAVGAYRDQAARAFARHKTVFVSDFLRRQFLRAVPHADLARCRVIHNVVDYPRLHAAALSAPLARRGDLLLVGRIDTGKGFGEFLDALRGRLAPHVRVSVAGDGPQRVALERRHGGGQVRFLGWQDYPATLALMARAHLCVVPSVCEEACSTTVLEALALGRPCLALARGGTPELARYASWPGQLGLADSIAGLAQLAASRLDEQPCSWPPAASFGADAGVLLPRLLELYADQSEPGAPHVHGEFPQHREHGQQHEHG